MEKGRWLQPGDHLKLINIDDVVEITHDIH